LMKTKAKFCRNVVAKKVGDTVGDRCGRHSPCLGGDWGVSWVSSIKWFLRLMKTRRPI
jgi:hypothetical protein